MLASPRLSSDRPKSILSSSCPPSTMRSRRYWPIAARVSSPANLQSLMQCATKLGVSTTIVTPPGYEPAKDVADACRGYASASGCKLVITSDPAAVAGSHAVYTDVWVLMGQTDQASKRTRDFARYQVNGALMATAGRGLAGGKPSLFMHCLPAQRGVEVTDEVIDSPHSIVYDQAENRMHAQNALLLEIFGKGTL